MGYKPDRTGSITVATRAFVAANYKKENVLQQVTCISYREKRVPSNNV
jgi:hypothetical protein